MALHELATNAAKYGALSVPQGRVAIEWELAGKQGEARTLLLRWRERNGPKVQEPARKGFGHIVMERTLADSLQGERDVGFRAGRAEVGGRNSRRTASISSMVSPPARPETRHRLKMPPIRH